MRSQLEQRSPAQRALPADTATHELMLRFERAFMVRDVAAVVACVTDDFEWSLPEGPDQPNGLLIRGRDQFESFIAGRFKLGLSYSDFSHQILGSTVVQRYVVKGTVPGRPHIFARGLDVYTIRDGLISTKDAYWKGHFPARTNADSALESPSGDKRADVRSLVEVLVATLQTPALREFLGRLSRDQRVTSDAKAVALNTKPEIAEIDEHVITEQLLRRFGKRRGQIRVPERAIITPSARDFARDNQIRIERGS